MKLKDVNYKKYLSVIIFSLLIVSVLGFVISAGGDSVSGGDTSSITEGDVVIGPNKFFQLFYGDTETSWWSKSAAESESGVARFLGKVFGFLGLGGTWKEIIVGVIVFLILFVGLLDILTLTSIFEKANPIIAIGLAAIATLSGLVRGIAVVLLSMVAWLGTIGIIIELLVAIFIFIGLSLANTKIAMWAAKKYGNLAKVKAVKTSGNVVAAIAGLRKIQEEFANK